MSDELPAPIEGQALIYATADGTVRVEVLLGDETFWLTINRMAELFGTTKQTISYHRRKIYASGELSRDATVKGIVTVQKEGSRNVSRTLERYNLDAVISVGYRVNSRLATQFRIRATRTHKEFTQLQLQRCSSECAGTDFCTQATMAALAGGWPASRRTRHPSRRPAARGTLSCSANVRREHSTSVAGLPTRHPRRAPERRGRPLQEARADCPPRRWSAKRAYCSHPNAGRPAR